MTGPRRAGLIAALCLLLAVAGCGLKGDPQRPAPADRPEKAEAR